MGSATTIDHHPGKSTVIENMTAELQSIMDRVKTIEQRSADLAEQISIHAQRHSFLTYAWQESRKVADEISFSAEQRVDSVTARAKSIVAPQQDQITYLNQEIRRLEHEVSAREADNPAYTIPADLKITPLTIQVDNVIDLTAYLHLPPHRQETGITTTTSEDAAGISQPVHPIPAEAAAQLNGIASAVLEQEPVLQPENDHGATADDNRMAGNQSGITDESRIESPVYRGDAGAVETMHFDTEINIYHNHSGPGWHRPKHRHHWKLQLQVEIPEHNVDVVYIQISAAITATLARFDDILLNRVFPFDIIEPSQENVAAYFFNCLEDTLVLKELILKELVLVEDDIPQMTINSRSTDIEEMLKGEDLIQDMRTSLLDKSKNGKVAADRPAKKKFGFLKRG